MIQLVLDDQDPDSEKHELADKEHELWLSKATDIFGLCGLGDVMQCAEYGVVYCIMFVDDFTIPQFRPPECKQIINTGSDRMAEPLQAQGGAEQTEGTAASVLAWANRELGLALATDKVAYLVDTYLDMQAADAGIAHNPTDAGLMVFAQGTKGERIPYPMDPNSAELNMTAAVTHNVHALAIMPYSERVVRTETNSYTLHDDFVLWEYTPSTRLFNNARCWVYRQPNI
ncbi:phosphoribosylformylglycinamidine synthase [Coemansia sp. RSA 2702]|nr:phosphoribosylformylglycinamidine synthase [Coemansia sp. RSA 2702]